MSLPLVSDDLWEAIEPVLPRERPKPKGGRPRVPDRAALTGIVFILRAGTPWRLLPRELGCGSGTRCWRRLRDWQAAGVWEQLHSTLLSWLGDEGAIDWSRASLDSVSVRAKRGGAETGPNPVDRGKCCSKYHLVVDRNGIPLAVRLSAANVHDSNLLEPIVDAIPAVVGPRGRPGRPRKRPASFMPTKRTTRRRSAALSASEASRRASPGAAWSRASAWADTGGSRSGAWRGCSAAAGSECATSAGRTCSRACCT
jgi:transposase